MTNILMTDETICDLQGEPLHPDSTTIIKAFEKLLTVGAYYSSEHEQYLQAATRTCNDFVAVMKKSNRSILLEITGEGLTINGQIMPPQHRHVRLLYDLLVPLNIAQLEIFATLTPDDLRQTILVFQDHKMALGKSLTFQEVIFDNLPHSVRPVSCNVFQNSNGSPDTDVPLDELEETAENKRLSWASNEFQSTTKELASKFMEMVTQILENLEQHGNEPGAEPQVVENGSYISKTDLIHLKQALQKLVEVNPDPEDLAQLISQAQHALSLSQDPKSVNLVFDILRKDIVQKAKSNPGKKDKKQGPPKFKLSIDELLGAVTVLEKSGKPVVDPREGSRSNQLAICLHLLLSDPPVVLRSGIIKVLESAVAHREFVSQNLLLFAETFHTVLLEDKTDNFDELLAQILGILRHKRPKMIGPFWVYMTELCDENQMRNLWPHLVNDILLGLEGTPRETVVRLVLIAGRMPLEIDGNHQSQLASQPALQGHSASRDIFRAPIGELHALYVILANSPLKNWLGKELFRALKTKPESKLIKVVVTAMGENRPEYLPFYLDMIKHHADPNPPEEFCIPAAEILLGALSDAPPEVQKADWIPRGLIELGKLDLDMARPLLESILNDRHMIFFKSWPEPARKAAAQALSGRNRVVN